MDNTFCKSSFLHVIAFATCVFAYCKCLAVDQTTQWWQVPPTSIVHQVGIDAGLGNCDCHGKHYAMFVIPLNYKLDDHFTKFELKASTNNFTAADEWDRIVFWSLSTIADVIPSTNGTDIVRSDGMRLYIENLPQYYDQFATNIIDKSLMPTNSMSIDSRRYTRISNSLAVDNAYVLETGDPYYVASYVVIVDADLCRSHLPTKEWLSNENDELIWTYSRATSASVEKDQHGRILWRPIAPVKWFKTLPKWADCEPIDNFND